MKSLAYMHGYICCVCIREVTNRDEEGDIPDRKPSVVKFDPATSKCILRLVVCTATSSGMKANQYTRNVCIYMSIHVLLEPDFIFNLNHD